MVRRASKGVGRAFDILNIFIGAKTDLGVSELSRELGWSKSAIHRILISLEEAGYVACDPISHRYRLGFKAIHLGLAAQHQAEIRRLAYHRMVQLRDATRETITLGILVGDERVYLEVVESPQEIRQTVQVGVSHPLYVGASGKSILAFLPTERQEQILAGAVGKARADGLPLDLKALRRDLAEIRRRGYAASCSERILGAASIAAPLFNNAGDVVGGLSVAGLAIRITEKEIEQFAPLVLAAANEISRDMGYVASDRGTT